MIDKQTKRKLLKRIWCKRLVIGLCLPVALGFSIVKVQSVYREANLTWKRQQAAPHLLHLQQGLQGFQQAEQHLQQAAPHLQHLQQGLQGFQQAEQHLQQAFQHLQQAEQHLQKALQQAEPHQQQALQQAFQHLQQVYLQTQQQTYHQAFQQPFLPQPYLQARQTKLQKRLEAYQKYKQVYLQTQQQTYNQAYPQAQQQKLQQESLFLAISVFCFIVMLLLLLRQQNRISLTLTGQLICFFPEECIAELEALHQQMKSEQRSTWLIRIIMLQNFLELFLAFYIQINIENLWLPQHRGRKKSDE